MKKNVLVFGLVVSMFSVSCSKENLEISENEKLEENSVIHEEDEQEGKIGIVRNCSLLALNNRNFVRAGYSLSDVPRCSSGTQLELDRDNAFKVGGMRDGAPDCRVIRNVCLVNQGRSVRYRSFRLTR